MWKLRSQRTSKILSRRCTPLSEEAQKESRPAPRGQIPPDTIFIGKKPIMAYATAVMMHFNTGSNHLIIKARGRSISTAVDVAEVVNRRFFASKLTHEVSLGTETVGEGTDTRNVSTIEIRLNKTS